MSDARMGDNRDAARSSGPLRELGWPAILALGAFALIRPLSSIAGADAWPGRPATQLLLTGLISLVWIAVVGFARMRHPLLTLVCAGLTYAVLSTLLSAVLSPILLGSLQGPLTNPFAIVSVLVVNAVWGGICGLLAIAVRKTRGVRDGASAPRTDRDD